MRGATNMPEKPIKDIVISTHAPLAGRDDGSAPQRLITRQISTHAPLAGRDLDAALCAPGLLAISTHAPLAGRDRDKQIA